MNGAPWGEKSLRRIYTLAYRFTGDSRLAAALAEEVLVHLAGRGWTLEPWDRVRLLIYKELSNLYLDKYGPPPAPNLVPNDRAAVLQQALNVLSPEEKVAVILRDVGRLSLDEVEAVLAWPRPKVGAALARGRCKLCRFLTAGTGGGQLAGRIPPG